MLEVSHVTKRYKEFTLDDISFSLPKGYIMGCVGQNGAGKSTTINCITQLCSANEGNITVDGIHYEENPSAYKEAIGFVGDESYFPKEMKIEDIRGIQKSFYKSFDEQKFDALVKEFELPLKKKINDFSRGMKVKLMFVAALSRETKLLVLDEATNGLDPVMRADILKILQDYIAGGERSILFSTHMLEDLEQIADYIIFIHKGKIILNETKDELLESYLLVKGDPEELTQENQKYMIGYTKQEFGFTALVKSNDAAYMPKDFVVDKPTIDQIMIYMIREGTEKKGRI
jgi:ABC-2 type transport system ATP-binding protein